MNKNNEIKDQNAVKTTSKVSSKDDKAAKNKKKVKKPVDKKTKIKRLIITIVIILITCGIVTTGYFVYKNLSKGDVDSYQYLIEKENSVFGNGLVCVQNEGIYGYLNEKGEVVIDFQYDSATKFLNGFAAVEVNGEWFVINTKGNNVIKERYDSVKISDNGLIIYEDNLKFGVINNKGHIIVQALYDSVSTYTNGLAVIKLNNQYGYIDENGHLVINREYDLAYPFSDGIGLIKKDDRYAYINTKGENVTEFIFDSAFPFINGLAIVARENQEGILKYGIIDATGKTFVTREYDEINRKYFSENNVFIAKKDNLYYIINSEGQVINPLGYANIEYDNVTKFLIASTSDTAKILINDENKTLLTNIEEYDAYELVIDLEQKYFGLNDNGKWFLYDDEGYNIISYQCESMYVFGERIIVEKDNQFGVIDFQGKVIVDFVYDDMTVLIDGYAAVEIAGNHGVINSDGKIIVPIKYQDVLISLE